MVEHTHWHTLALLGCFDRSRTDVWGFFCPGRDRDRGMEREGNRWIVSQHSAFVSAPWRQRDFPLLQPAPPHTPKIHSKWDSPLCAGQSRLDRPIWFHAMQGGEGGLAGGHKKTQRGRKIGGDCWQHTARLKKRYLFVKNKCLMSFRCFTTKGEKKKSLFFLLLFKLVAQKQQITFTSHLLAPCTWVRIL